MFWVSRSQHFSDEIIFKYVSTKVMNCFHYTLPKAYKGVVESGRLSVILLKPDKLEIGGDRRRETVLLSLILSYNSYKSYVA